MKSRFALFVCMILGIQGFASIAQAKTPDDTFYFKQWYLQQIRAEEAWEKTTGSKQVVVAVIDTAVDIDHEDLRGNIWTNPNEVAGNGIDDDGNGFIDDIHGWNFVDDSAELRPNAEDRQEAFVHGTLVASLIGAEGNNSRGIAGVAWHVSIMPLVGLDASGSGSTVDVANAVNYAVLHGADIINLSIEGHLRDPLLDEAIAFARSAACSRWRPLEIPRIFSARTSTRCPYIPPVSRKRAFTASSACRARIKRMRRRLMQTTDPAWIFPRPERIFRRAAACDR